MRQAILMTLAVLAQGVLAGPAPASPARADAVAEARVLLASHSPEKAVEVLEEALLGSGPADRTAIVDLLRQSYKDLIARSEAAGKRREAEVYRDNLSILDQGPGAVPPAGSPAAPVAYPSTPERQEPLPITQPGPSGSREAPASEARRLPRSSQVPDQALLREPAAVAEPRPADSPALEGPASGPARPPVDEPRPNSPGRAGPVIGAAPPDTADPAGPAASPGRGGANEPAVSTPARAEDDLAQADQLFGAKKYEEAGRIYARSAGQNRLPAQRRQVWAYCRWVTVVARINAHPRTDREWDAIEQEIRSIQRLTPGNWYGEYLQSRVAEARRGGRSSGRAGKVVVRGSEPEEDRERDSPRPLGRPKDPASAPRVPPGSRSMPVEEPPAPGAVPRDAFTMAPAPGLPEDAKPASPTAPPTWHVRETANFSIYHTDAALAERVGKAAEGVRAQQAKRWGSSGTKLSWSPRCEIYLYPTSRQFAQMTGQPESSPGFSTMGMSGSRVTARRVNLRADHPQMLEAILPHEVTHVVLADLFTQQQIPRWADEGMAVLAEPLAEQLNRAADLTAPLKEGRVFKLSDLMAIDYPSAESWGLYYAQSVSLTQFLVKHGTPEQFVTFVRAAQKTGVEASLRTVYKIDGFPDLEERWQRFAIRQAGELTASGASGSAADTTRRR